MSAEKIVPLAVVREIIARPRPGLSVHMWQRKALQELEAWQPAASVTHGVYGDMVYKNSEQPPARGLPMVGGYKPSVEFDSGFGWRIKNGAGEFLSATTGEPAYWNDREATIWPTRAAAEAAIRQFAAREEERIASHDPILTIIGFGRLTDGNYEHVRIKVDNLQPFAVHFQGGKVVKAYTEPKTLEEVHAEQEQPPEHQHFGCVKNTIRLLGGTYFDFLDPQPHQFTLADIANALSKICRFGGQVGRFYSVAEHCCRCADQAMADGMPPMGCVAALMHDAAESFVGDMVKPLKVMMPGYAEVESRVEAAIAKKWSIDFTGWSKVVREIDHAMLINERKNLFSKDDVIWAGENQCRELSGKPQCWTPEEACRQFIDYANGLGIYDPDPVVTTSEQEQAAGTQLAANLAVESPPGDARPACAVAVVTDEGRDLPDSEGVWKYHGADAPHWGRRVWVNTTASLFQQICDDRGFVVGSFDHLRKLPRGHWQKFDGQEAAELREQLSAAQQQIAAARQRHAELQRQVIVGDGKPLPEGIWVFKSMLDQFGITSAGDTAWPKMCYLRVDTLFSQRAGGGE